MFAQSQQKNSLFDDDNTVHIAFLTQDDSCKAQLNRLKNQLQAVQNLNSQLLVKIEKQANLLLEKQAIIDSLRSVK